MALELATLDAVLEEVTRAGILVQVGFQRRFDPGYRAAHEAVASGAVGTILTVRAATHDPAPPAREYIAASGGMFRDLAIHDFDAIRFVTGQEVVEVYADGGAVATPWFEEYGDFDTAVAVLRLGGGALGSSRGPATIRSGTTSASRSSARTTASASGSTGGRRFIRSSPASGPPGASWYGGFAERFESAYRAELAAFVDAVLGGGASPCSLEDARAALAVAVAADRSCAERRPVRIDE